MNKIVKIGLVVIVSVGLILAGWFGNQYYTNNQIKSAEKSANTFIKYLTDGDTETAYNALNASSKETIKIEEFKDNMGDLKSEKAKIESTITAKGNGGQYIVISTLEDLTPSPSGSTSSVMTLRVSKDNGTYKVDSILVE
jgi:hypothetical protein